MGCFIVKSIVNTDMKCIVNWSYQGKLNLRSQPIYVSPGFKDKEDAANFALSFMVPVSVIYGDIIKLPYSISKSSYNFWKAKINSISSFYKQIYPINIIPVENRLVENHSGKDCALFWGGGIDSCSALVKLISEGKNPHLIRFHRIGKDLVDGLNFQYMKSIANHFDLKYTIIKQNFISYLKYLTRVVDKYIIRDNLYFFWEYPPFCEDRNHRKDVLFGFIWQGFHFFFASLGLVAGQINQLYMGGSTDDSMEAYCFGFNMGDNIGYRGINFDSYISGNKAEQFDLLYNRYPIMAKWIKSCPNEKVQWCKRCEKCCEASLGQLAVGVQNPISIQKFKIKFYPYTIGLMLNMLAFYRKNQKRQPEIEEKLILAIHSTMERAANVRGLK